MKTAEEILYINSGITLDQLKEPIIKAMKAYTEQAVNEALRMASERAKVNIWRSYPKEHNLDVTSLSTCNNFGKDVMTVSKQSILSLAPEIIAKLK